MKNTKIIYHLFQNLEEKITDQDFWFKLDKALRDYLEPYTDDEEEAFNKLLLELFKRAEHFTPAPNCIDSFKQKLYVIRLAYHNHKLKITRSEIAENLRILKYKQRKEELTEEELEYMKYLEVIKRKL